MKASFYIAILTAIIFFSSCESDEILTSNITLKFSQDSVKFDTVFTETGTSTQYFKVYNTYDKIIEIDEIFLAKGNRTNFRLNIDGKSTRSVKNIQIYPKDSLFIFVEATLDSTSENTPMVIQDSVVFITGGNMQDVDLIAWGQDVHVYDSKVVKTRTWTADKPYLIYGYLIVDSLETLTIEAGCQIYLHFNTSIWVLGKLIVEGTKEDPVIFQGDRLEDFYNDKPSQWGRIYFLNGSVDNSINYAIIKNGVTGLWLGSVDRYEDVNVIVKNTIIDNMSYGGILSFGGDIEAYNVVVSKVGSACVGIVRGGTHNFYQSTFYNGGGKYVSSDEPAVFVSNSFYCPAGYCNDTVAETFSADLGNAYFGNCIIYGGNDSEIGFNQDEDYKMNYFFDNCLIKVNPDSIDIKDEDHYGTIFHEDEPGFVSYEEDLHLDTLAFAKDKGEIRIVNLLPELEHDLDGESRTSDDGPDLGAYERIE